MTEKTSTYAKESLPDGYAHSFHAGNVGDVWKHIVLLAVLHSLVKESSPLSVVDCNAGAGGYRLAATGEWTEGIGALLKARKQVRSPLIDLYLKRIEGDFSAKRFYAGSPLLLESVMREQDTLRCYEINADARRELQALVAGSTEVLEVDGLGGLIKDTREAANLKKKFFALIDPPWVKKEDWQAVPRALIEAWKIYPQATFLLWYPIKSYTRVNSMIKEFQEAGLPAAVLDLITTPLENQRNRLNGSGLILVNGSAATIAEVSQAGTWIGRACSTHKGYWSLRATEISR